jgi:hypothetical protein
MKSLRNFLIALPLATALMFAQASQQDTSRATGQADMGTRTYTGTIVNANCSQASALMGPSAGTYADRGAPTDQTGATKKATKSSMETAKKDVLRHCQPTASTTSYALLTDDGNFIKLDDAGNQQVISQLMGGKRTAAKNIRASVTGTVQDGTIKVQSISKM